MKTRRFLLVTAVAALVVPVQPATGKGASRAIITGLGFDSAVRATYEGRVNLSRLANLTGIYGALFETEPNGMLASNPAETLGPRYDVGYVMSAPGHKTNVVHQDVYPFAAPSPVTYVAPDQPVYGQSRTVGGWYQATPALLRFFVKSGLDARATGDAPAAQSAAEGVAQGAAGKATGVEAGEEGATPKPGSSWLAIAGAFVLVLGAWAYTRASARRRRLRSAHA